MEILPALDDDFVGSRRRIGQERFLARSHADDERLEIPAAEQRSKDAESPGLGDDGNDSKNDEPEVDPEISVIDVG